MTELLDAPPLRGMTDDELATAWNTADIDNPAVFAAFIAEFDQRTAAESTKRTSKRTNGTPVGRPGATADVRGQRAR